MSPYPLLLTSFFIAVVPIILTIGTCFLKINIVLGMIKSALGTQHTPSALLVTCFSLVITYVVMEPVWTEVAKRSVIYIENKKIDLKKDSFQIPSLEEAREIFSPWIEFLEKHAEKKDVELFKSLSKQENSFGALIGGFTLSELRAAFLMAVTLLIPFVAVDVVLANVMVGLGMNMVSPSVIALPIKLLLFVYSDAWRIIFESLVRSYN